MKKAMITLALALLMGVTAAYAQLSSSGWQAGIGLGYPRYASINIDALNTNIGGYLSIQRNFSEYLGVRLKAGYSHLEGQYTDGSLDVIKEETGMLTGDLDVLFYPIPCEEVSPYIFAGGGGNYKTIDKAQTGIPDANKMGAQLNMGAGVDFNMAADLKLTAEFGYHITDGSSLEGTIVPSEVNAQDSYLAFTLGVSFLFANGSPSTICEVKQAPGEGVSQAMKDRINYNSSVIDKYVLSIVNDKLILEGVTFESDKSTLEAGSEDVLDKTVKIMKDKPAMKVEVQGYTDYMGSNDHNISLALARAKTVKDYLVSKGIAAGRLTTISYGQSDSRGDNKTAAGREENRKIVLKVLKDNGSTK